MESHLEEEVTGTGNRSGELTMKVKLYGMQMKEAGSLTKTLAHHEKKNKQADGSNLAYGQPAFFLLVSPHPSTSVKKKL